MISKLNKDISYHAQQWKIKNTTIWWLKKINETNSCKIKIWGEFNLTIIKIKQISFRKSKFLQLDLTLNLLLSPVVTYKHDYVQTLNLRTSFLLDLHHTSIHACDFEIPFKGFRSRLVDLYNNYSTSTWL